MSEKTCKIDLTEEEAFAVGLALKFLCGNLHWDKDTITAAFAAFEKIKKHSGVDCSYDPTAGDWEESEEVWNNLFSGHEMLVAGIGWTALEAKRKLNIEYSDAHNATSSRTVLPIHIDTSSNAWRRKLIAWCEMKNDFRQFNLEQITKAEMLPENYILGEHQSLQEFEKHLRKQKKAKAESRKCGD
jgi:predicted DNA-binding transcriptional regulator YafY